MIGFVRQPPNAGSHAVTLAPKVTFEDLAMRTAGSFFVLSLALVLALSSTGCASLSPGGPYFAKQAAREQQAADDLRKVGAGDAGVRVRLVNG